VNKLS